MSYYFYQSVNFSSTFSPNAPDTGHVSLDGCASLDGADGAVDTVGLRLTRRVFVLAVPLIIFALRGCEFLRLCWCLCFGLRFGLRRRGLPVQLPPLVFELCSRAGECTVHGGGELSLPHLAISFDTEFLVVLAHERFDLCVFHEMVCMLLTKRAWGLSSTSSCACEGCRPSCTDIGAGHVCIGCVALCSALPIACSKP